MQTDLPSHQDQFDNSSIEHIPNDWQIVQLKSLASLITSGPRGWASFYSEQGPLFLRIGNLTREHVHLRWENLIHVSPPLGSEGSRTAIQAGDVLISITADLGIIGVIPLGVGEAYVNQHIALVRIDDKLAHPLWIGNYLASTSGQKQFYRLNDAGAKAGLNLPTVSSLLIVLPPLAEQRRIAAILDTVDAAIQQTEALIAKLKLMKAGLLHDLLTRGLDEQAHLRDPSAHPEQFKDSPLGRIPREWEIKALEECVRPGTTITYGIVQAGPHIEDGVPYIRTGDMAGDQLVLEGLLRTSKQIVASYQRSEVHTGEIVCTIRASVGKVLEVPPELDGANISRGVARIAPIDSINNHFLLWSLQSGPVIRQFEFAIKGTTFPEITLKRLQQLVVAIPSSRSEQDQIATILDAHDARIRAEEAYCDKLKQLKKGLMHDLLTGRVRVQAEEEAR